MTFFFDFVPDVINSFFPANIFVGPFDNISDASKILLDYKSRSGNFYSKKSLGGGPFLGVKK